MGHRSLVNKGSVFALYGKFFTFSLFYMTYNAGINVERLGDTDDIGCYLLWDIEFHAVSTIEYLIHLSPRGMGLLLNEFEKGRYREEVVLDYM